MISRNSTDSETSAKKKYKTVSTEEKRRRQAKKLQRNMAKNPKKADNPFFIYKRVNKERILQCLGINNQRSMVSIAARLWANEPEHVKAFYRNQFHLETAGRQNCSLKDKRKTKEAYGPFSVSPSVHKTESVNGWTIKPSEIYSLPSPPTSPMFYPEDNSTMSSSTFVPPIAPYSVLPLPTPLFYPIAYPEASEPPMSSLDFSSSLSTFIQTSTNHSSPLFPSTTVVQDDTNRLIQSIGSIAIPSGVSSDVAAVCSSIFVDHTIMHC
ncbi:hypothetical protein BC833DRAFT_603298 [Globomyces pollinis-pini]|nr:hypothetical protein BC833DRAFT_603298 [Globomyces pollinis-pini]